MGGIITEEEDNTPLVDDFDFADGLVKVGVCSPVASFEQRYFISIEGEDNATEGDARAEGIVEAEIDGNVVQVDDLTITTRDESAVGGGEFLDTNPWKNEEGLSGGEGPVSRPVTAPSGLEFNLDGGKWESKTAMNVVGKRGGGEKSEFTVDSNAENENLKKMLLEKDRQMQEMMDELTRLRQIASSVTDSVSELSFAVN